MAIDYYKMTVELEADEGTRLTLYDDATGEPVGPGHLMIGHPTIGTGRALDTNGLRHEETRMLLANDIADYVAQLTQLTWYRSLDPIRQRAIVNMRHQLGLDGLLQFHAMTEALGDEQWDAAAEAGLDSKWAHETPARAHRLMDMIRTGVAPLVPSPNVPAVVVA